MNIKELAKGFSNRISQGLARREARLEAEYGDRERGLGMAQIGLVMFIIAGVGGCLCVATREPWALASKFGVLSPENLAAVDSLVPLLRSEDNPISPICDSVTIGETPALVDALNDFREDNFSQTKRLVPIDEVVVFGRGSGGLGNEAMSNKLYNALYRPVSMVNGTSWGFCVDEDPDGAYGLVIAGDIAHEGIGLDLAKKFEEANGKSFETFSQLKDFAEKQPGFGAYVALLKNGKPECFPEMGYYPVEPCIFSGGSGKQEVVVPAPEITEEKRDVMAVTTEKKGRATTDDKFMIYEEPFRLETLRIEGKTFKNVIMEPSVETLPGNLGSGTGFVMEEISQVKIVNGEEEYVLTGKYFLRVNHKMINYDYYLGLDENQNPDWKLIEK